MDQSKTLDEFFTGSSKLHDKELLRNIIKSLPPESSDLYDLTFHAAFAKRIFDIIRREGPHTQGFDRMQQSFFEAVEKVKEILKNIEAENPVVATELTASTPEAKAKLSRFIEDLALLKNWLMSRDTK